MPAPFVRLGRVVKTHGLEGEVSVAVRDDLPSASLVGLDVWFVPPLASGAVAYRIGAVRPGPKGTLVHIEGVDSTDAAREIPGRWLLARAADVPDAPPAPDDLSDYSVLDEARGLLGTVTDTIVTGANDVFVVEGGPFGRVLIPVIDDVVLSVDGAQRTIHVRLLPGLIDEDGS